MNVNKTLILTSILVTLISACDNKLETQAMPEVNDENCKTENILKIKDKEIRQEFGSRCFLRTNKYKPSQQRSW